MPPKPSSVPPKTPTLAVVRSAAAAFEVEYRTYQKASDRFRISAEKYLDVVSPVHAKPPSASDSESSSRAKKDQKPLSKREAQILKLIAEGSGTKQAADFMGIAFKTAVGHRSKLMQKLGIHDAASLTRYAIRNGHVVA
jgi:DNA-binding NarL/FixJ family response regulator